MKQDNKIVDEVAARVTDKHFGGCPGAYEHVRAAILEASKPLVELASKLRDLFPDAAWLDELDDDNCSGKRATVMQSEARITLGELREIDAALSAFRGGEGT